MADVSPGAEKAAVAIKDVAIALMPDRGRAPVLNEKYMAMSELLKKGKGESIFKAAVAEKDDDIYVNFTEMRQMVDGDKLPEVRDEDQPARWKRLNLRLNIYDKWLNNGMKDLTPEESVDIRNVLVEIPGFCEAIAVATGGRLSFEQAKNYLTGKGGAGLNQDEKKVITEILSRFLGDDQLKIRLEKSLSSLSSMVDENDASLAHEIEGIKEKIKGKDELLKRITKLETSQQAFKDLDELDKQKAEDLYKKTDAIINTLKVAQRPATKTLAGVNTAISQLREQISTINTTIRELNTGRVSYGGRTQFNRSGDEVGSITTPTIDQTVSALYKDKINERDNMLETMTQLESLKTVFADDADLISAYESYSNAKDKLTEVNKDITTISDSERLLIEKEGKRNKYADKYKRKLERTLSEEIKKYWNDVKLADAAAAADAEASQKAKDKAEAKTLDELRGKKARELMTKYLKMSFLKYKGDKCVGYEDKDLKKFVHKDMLSMSPTEIARYLLERVHDRTGMMPSRYEEEMMETLKEMGVGKSKIEGEPPLTFDQMLKEISDETYYDLAKDFVPDVLGYAQDRKYYFDRLKLKKHEAEFLKENYTIEFFNKMKASRDKQVEFAEKLLGYKVLSGGLTEDNLRKVFGEDWTEGLKRAGKTLAVGAAVGAGAYVLGGGLGYPTLAEGLTHVVGGTDPAGVFIKGTLPTMYEGVVNSVAAGSRVTEDILSGGALATSLVSKRIMPDAATAQAFKAAGNFYIPGLLP
ncbi:hypothetical protein COY90_03405 [Candidatus Roizmanbacteria bacterium CG_4_10_14_0_8_um_filter_39_9]|uniref:Uncharacterized protein n=1 Tax=Candidatus Roizmanbacteria bacterium CG_4_10_14_0_8_um_filter_39_9 TaxID=1974829 RepID=A0A2M7QDF6_9BACT|nr:MAG: hypothetical protein COY90_03405 [Candidatus Roizmanbacteria bacterium CG_4_10_14_0_8_um_filter_39_9]